MSGRRDVGGGPAVTVLAATEVEALPLRRRLRGNPEVRVTRSGVGLSRWAAVNDGLLLSCGLAGALGADLPTGTVVIPDEVGLGGAATTVCDAAAVARLRDAARRCGVDPHGGPLLTVDHLVSGAERVLWWGRGYAAVDMESGRLGERAAAFAAVRVILDTPHRELSGAWSTPLRAITRPRRWPEALWLARVAPRLCDLVARIVVEAFSQTPTAPARGRSEPPARPAW